MTGHIHWLLSMKIKQGCYDQFLELITEMVAASKANEPGALIYEYYVSDDKTTCDIYERYSDNAAVKVHMGNFSGKFAERFIPILEPVRLTVYGNPDGAVQKALKGLAPVYMKQAAGFAR